MKKEISKKISEGKVTPKSESAVRASKKTHTTNKASKNVTAANYAKVISYIVRVEEDETRLMVASSSR